MQDSISSAGYKGPSRSLLSNLLITTLSVGLVVWSIKLIQEKVTYVKSSDAIVNGVLIDIKAPQQGMVAGLSTKTGEDKIQQGKTLLTIKNDRVSELQVQSIKSKLSEQRVQLDRAETRLARLQSLLKTATADKGNQHQLETLEAGQVSQKLASDIQGAQARYRLAQVNYERTAYLRQQGAISQASLDARAAEVEQRKAEVSSLENQLAASRTNQQAAQLGLTLSKTRSDADPRIRLEELQLQITDQQEVIDTLKQKMRDTEAELVQATRDMQKQNFVAVNVPATGIVWRMNVQQGRYVQQGESLGQVLDCNRRWVDAFVDEQAVRSLQPGTPATVKLYGTEARSLQGQISMIRSGLGRLAAGEEIAVPTAPNLPRKAQVRIELEPDTQSSLGRFCYVGYTGEVTFKVQ